MADIIQIGIVGPNPPDIIAWKNVRESSTGGYDSVGNTLTVNLSLTVGGKEFRLQNQEIHSELFLLLKEGPTKITSELVPFGKAAPPVQDLTPEITHVSTKQEYKSSPKQIEVVELVPSPEPIQAKFTQPNVPMTKRKSAYETRLGTSGKNKFYQGTIVSWVDIVTIAQEKCGMKSKLSELYDWAADHIYCTDETGRIKRFLPDSGLPNWQASIRQNRSKARKMYEDRQNQNLEKIPIPVVLKPLRITPTPFISKSKKYAQVAKPQKLTITKFIPNSPAVPQLATAEGLQAEMDDILLDNGLEAMEDLMSPTEHDFENETNLVNATNEHPSVLAFNKIVDELRKLGESHDEDQTKIPMTRVMNQPKRTMT